MEKTPYASYTSQRVILWTGLILMTVYMLALVVLMGVLPPPPATLTATEVQALYSAHNLQFRLGTMIATATGGALLFFSVVIGVQMARLEKGVPIWAIIQVLAGSIGTLFAWIPAVAWGTAAYTVERAPELTLLMHEFAWLFFITPVALVIPQYAAVAVLCFIKKEDEAHTAFPRWMGYLTIWVAVQSMGGPFPYLFKHGIFAWGGLIPFWLPFGLFGVWALPLSYRILKALRYQQANGL